MGDTITADEYEGVRVVLTPAQLASVMVGGNISEDETWSNRLWGGAKVIFGGLELLGAAGLALAPEPTMVTKAGAVVLAGHGGDTIGTGLRQVWTGQPEKTNTERLAAATAEALGADKDTAATIGVAVDIAVPIAVAGVVAAGRAVATRAGQISLLAEEAAGGHTIARHIGRTEAQLRARLAAQTGIPAASTFKTLAQAEAAVSQAIRANSSAIQAWATAAGGPGKLALPIFDCGKVIGEGVVRSTGLLTKMNKVQVVLRKTNVGGKLYYVLTSYPCL